MYRKYGAVPQEVYTGLNYGTKINKTAELGDIEKGVLEAVVKNANGELTPNWLKAYTGVIDAYLGAVPENFTYNGKKYTPKTSHCTNCNADHRCTLPRTRFQKIYDILKNLFTNTTSSKKIFSNTTSS
jgi:bleomycin hydrolase